MSFDFSIPSPSACCRALAALAVVLLPACESTKRKSVDPDRPILEDRSVRDAYAKELKALQDQFNEVKPVYEKTRRELLAKEPRVAPWIAKWMVAVAVADADRFIGRGLVPERIARVDRFKNAPLFRARRELEKLGATGRKAILVYLLRDRRTQLRSVGRLLLRVHDQDALRADLIGEFAEGNTKSRREVLQMLGEIAPHPSSRDLLMTALGNADWQLRGTAIRALGRFSRLESDKSAFVKTAWRLHEEDGDLWVRGRALLAIADAQAVDQVRAIVERLETLMKDGRGKEIAAAIEALRELTGRDYGSNVTRWRTWLDGKRERRTR